MYEDERKTELGEIGTPISKEAVESFLENIPNDPNVFVSFQDVDFLKINPRYSNDITPRGVYGFPSNYLTMIASSYLKHGKGRLELLGCIRRPNAFTYSVDGRVIDLESYREFIDDAAKLHEWSSKNHRACGAVIDGFLRSPSIRTVPEIQGKCLLWTTEKMVDRILHLEHSDETFKSHPKKPETWQRIFQGINVSAIVDRGCILTGGDFPNQTVVFDDNAIEIIAHFENPMRTPGIINGLRHGS